MWREANSNECPAGNTASLYASESEVHCPRSKIYVAAVLCARAEDKSAPHRPLARRVQRSSSIVEK